MTRQVKVCDICEKDIPISQEKRSLSPNSPITKEFKTKGIYLSVHLTSENENTHICPVCITNLVNSH